MVGWGGAGDGAGDGAALKGRRTVAGTVAALKGRRTVEGGINAPSLQAPWRAPAFQGREGRGRGSGRSVPRPFKAGRVGVGVVVGACPGLSRPGGRDSDRWRHARARLRAARGEAANSICDGDR